MCYNGFKKKNGGKQITCIDCGVAKHRLGALMAKTVPKTRGQGISSSHWTVFRVFTAKRTALIWITSVPKEKVWNGPGDSFSQLRSISGEKWVKEGASPKAGYSSLIVTDEHQTLGDGCQNIFQWVQKEKNEKTIVLVEHGVAKHRFSGNFCSENQGIRQFYPRIGRFFPFFLRETDRTNLMNIRTKREGLKPLRSREISC